MPVVAPLPVAPTVEFVNPFALGKFVVGAGVTLAGAVRLLVPIFVPPGDP